MVWIEKPCHFRFRPPESVRWPPVCAERKDQAVTKKNADQWPAMDLHRTSQWICIGPRAIIRPWSLIHFRYHASWFLLVRPKFNFLRDLMLMEVSELNGFVRFIVRSICKQFCSCWCACIIRILFRLIHWFFFFCCFFRRSGLLECWILRQYDCMFGAISMAVLYAVKRLASSSVSWSLTLPSKEQDGSCSMTNTWQLSTHQRRRIPTFIPHGIKASLYVCACWPFCLLTILFVGTHKWVQCCGTAA
jgi:hypothetical protein